MEIQVQSKRRNSGISDVNGMGVGRLVLVAQNDDERMFISSIYRCMSPTRPLTAVQDKADRKAVRYLRAWLRDAEAHQKAAIANAQDTASSASDAPLSDD